LIREKIQAEAMFYPQSPIRINSKDVKDARNELIKLIENYGIGAIASALKEISINELRGKDTFLGGDHIWLRTQKAATYIIEPINDQHIELRQGERITRYYSEDTQIEQIEVIADPDPNYEWIPTSFSKTSPELAAKRLSARNSEDNIKWSDLECKAAVIVVFERIYSPAKCRKSWAIGGN
jgi:hypothetical protein